MSVNTSTDNKKSVRFVDENDECNVVYIYKPLTAEAPVWITDAEHQTHKEASRSLSIQLRREGADRLLDMSFATPASDVQKKLNEWTKHTDGRGLERLSCPKHFEERMLHRKLAIRAILLGQEQARKQGLKDVSEQLRELSLQYCCSAKIFARRMGKADEHACNKKSKSGSSNSSTGSLSKKSSSSKSKKTAIATKAESQPRAKLPSVYSSGFSKACSARSVLAVAAGGERRNAAIAI